VDQTKADDLQVTRLSSVVIRFTKRPSRHVHLAQHPNLNRIFCKAESIVVFSEHSFGLAHRIHWYPRLKIEATDT